MTPSKRAIVAGIERAFRGVTREGGVSWREALALDPFAKPPLRSAASYADKDRNWSDLVRDEAWQPDPGSGGLAFFDAVGFRYYLPVCMVKAVAHPGRIDFSEHLTPTGHRAESRRSKWSSFNAAQLEAVSHFVHYMVRETELEERGWDGTVGVDWFRKSGWTEAFRTYWYRHDPERDELYDLRPEITPAEAAMIGRIEDVFAGVTLGKGVGWYEADAIDGGGINQVEERARDERHNWHNLLVNPDFMCWVSRSQYLFMDAEGLRFALPAEMIRSIRIGGEETLSWNLTLHPHGATDDLGREIWAYLNQEQRHCIAAFLRLMVAQSSSIDEEDLTHSDWHSAYQSYWHNFDADM